MARDDPRTRGFNYSGWGADPKPPIYQTACRIARVLGKQSADMSHEAWDIEMKIRNVRLATTAPEKATAVNQLTEYVAKYHNLVAH